ncbi:3-hydroxyacyl-CoA dehydrogenase family protein [Streptomyces hawaiiensis]|uniref:3-hydroxyacyl-CoA dehydrogenase family protein n=1 Tax=Streptomyces hawaiiensis TaxID=67305 RepID=UPI00364DA897
MTQKPSVIGVVGLGAVGEAMLRLVADAGYTAVGVDRELDVLARVERRMKARSGGHTWDKDGCTLTNDTALLARADVVIEAVDEDLATKVDVLRRLHSLCPNETVLLSTTASLPLPRLAIASGRPERTGGLRLFRPPVVGGAVESVFTSMSLDDAISTVEQLVAQLGLAPTAVGTHAGPLATELVYASLNRAVALVEEGFVPAQSVDTAMRLGCGLPAGPLQLLDELGLDGVHAHLSELWARTGDDAFRPTPLLTSMVRGGALGRKSGEGFYRYDDEGRAYPGGGTDGAGSDAPGAQPVARVGVLGSGTMARGIAEVCAVAGLRTTLVARSEEKARRALDSVDASLTKAVRRGKVTPDQKAGALAVLDGAEDFGALADCDLVIEATAEDLPLKRSLFARLGSVCRPGALLATTTSSLSVATCTGPADRPGDVLGLHFFNPAPVMKLVELVRTPDTGDQVMAAARAFCDQLGKVAVECPDEAGFIVNRLLFPYLADAIRLLDRYGVDIKELDDAVKGGFGYPMGPFALLDSIGLDVSLAILRCLHKEFPDGGNEPPAAIKELVTCGFLGRKSGQGFRRA